MRRLLVVPAALAVLAITSLGAGAEAATNHELITGSGSSWAGIAVNQWVADVEPNGLRVVFTANGAAAGRKDFSNNTTDFGVSDIGYQGLNTATGENDQLPSRKFAYLPIVGGGTAFPYHIERAGKLVRNLRLSGLTLARIFTNQITNWSDPAITKDNNGVQLPSLPIIPVVHSEGAGTTSQFTKYLVQEFPRIWAPFNNGSNTFTEFYPIKGNAVGQNGSDGVMNYVSSEAANGAIGMDEYAYPLAKNYPSAKIENAAGVFTLPTQYNVAVALTQAHINMDRTSQNYLLQDLRDVYGYTDPRTYPLSSYVYAIIPTGDPDPTMDTGKRQTLADYLYYSICQGQGEIGPIGYSSLPVNLVQAGFAQIAKLHTADPGVDLTQRDIRTCHNPTFIAGHPSENHLAKIAPMPPACDRSGQGPCSDSVKPVLGPATTTGSRGNGSATSGAAAGSGGAVDPLTGASLPSGQTASATGSNDQTTVVPTLLAADPHHGFGDILGPVAALELLAVVLAPPLLYPLVRRRFANGGRT
jgi:ABC-type phosphate transport system substrate-binding protein